MNLICFRAGGYPKRSCQNYCAAQDPTAVYKPQSTYVTISDYYGPWGIFGGYPTYHQTPATCSWQKTTTQQVTKISLAADSTGHETGGAAWTGQGNSFNEETVVTGNRPLNLGSTVAVAVEVVSSEGPVMEGARITDGCNLGNVKYNAKCFGRSSAENFTIGLSLLIGGLAVLCCPCILLICCIKGCFGHDRAETVKTRAQGFAPQACQHPWFESHFRSTAPAGMHGSSQEPLNQTHTGYIKHQDRSEYGPA